MASIDGPEIASFEACDVADALALTAEAGWNQTAEDWAFFLANGTVYAARDASGHLVATAAILPYPGLSSGELAFAWVSLVIVSLSQRGHGLGTRMLQQCIAELRSRSLPGLLDATPAGEKVYVPLGFKPVLALQRWQGEGGVRARHGRVRVLAASGLARMTAVDASVFGANRKGLLANFCGRAGSRAFGLADGTSYALVRSGRIAAHVGPVIAANAEDAVELIGAAIASTRGLLYIDVPDAQEQIAVQLAAYGFTPQRPLLRMALAGTPPFGDPARMFAIAGPEYG